MNLAIWLRPPVLGLALLFLFTLVYLFFRLRLLNKTQPSGIFYFRQLAPIQQLLNSVGRALENGKGIHLSTGSGGVSGIRGAAGLTGLVMLSRIVLKSAKNDMPPQATSGDGILTALAQDTLYQSYTAAGSQRNFDPTQGQVTGITPFSYAAGAMLAAAGHPLEVNLLAGHFGPEAALIAEAADRSAQQVIASSDSLPAQSALLAAADQVLIGEELFAGGAYLQAGPAHQASLAAQDALRWVIILLILAGVILKLTGLL